jgi:Domain of unknown function (DUF4185)
MTRLLALSVLLAASSVLAEPAPPVPIPMPTSTDAGCLIQSDFRSSIGGNHHNFETVILQGQDLVHYWRDNGNVAEGWVRGQVITSQATGPGCIIQSDFRSGDHGNFEVIVPEGNNLVHYFHDNGDFASPWRRGQVISTASTGAGSIIESDFRDAEHGNFDVVVLEGHNLVHYFHENGNVANPWRQAQVISTAATSAGSIIQSNFHSGDHGNFEVVVREGANLVHYVHDNGNVANLWQRGQTISTTPGSAARLIQSDFHNGDHGNFELLTIEGGQLVHYFHDNSNVANPWQRGPTVAGGIGGSSAGFIQSDFSSSDHGNFEVVALAGNQVQHFFHDNSNVALPWRRAQIISPSTRSQKICQLTGDIDQQTRHATLNQTQTRFGVGGTDLGYPFMHDGRLYFAFGDTSGPGDSLAFTRDTDADECLHLTFAADGNRFRPISAPGVSLDFFEVPTTGFSANGAMYVFVWTDHKDLFNGSFSDPVGHTALLRSDDNGRTFRLIWDRLGDQFVYLAAAVVDNADVPALGQGPGRSLLIWGSGKFYRKSNPHFAFMPLGQVENKAAVRYFNGFGGDGRPVWGNLPDPNPDMGKLFDQACVGELSVTWNRNLQRWLMTYNCDSPDGGGVVARAAEVPWGPWSTPAVLFNADLDAGSCHFIRGPDDCGPPADPNSPAGNGPGGIYAPYIVQPYTRGGAQTTTVYYVMSTWNPYQVSLMRTTLQAPSPLPFGPDTCKQGFVWREVVPDDHVCVTPDTRAAVAEQNRGADANRTPDGGAFGPDTCKQGLVWREAFGDDHVCVAPAVRDQAASDNRAAASRRVRA